MFPEHSWAAIAHDLGDSLSHLGFIAVNLAFRAGAFVFTEGTSCQTLFGVRQELLTRGAQNVPSGSMMIATEHPYHDSYSLLFFLQAIHCRFLGDCSRRLSNSRMSVTGLLHA